MTDYLSLSDLSQNVVMKLRQVPGTSVQTYAEDHIAKLIREGFDLVAKDRFWPDLMEWNTFTLDGTTGKVTANLIDDYFIQRFADIRAIHYADDSRPMRLLPSSINPYRLASATHAMYLEPLRSKADTTGRLFRVWPITATGDVRVHARVIDNTMWLDADETIPFDAMFLENYAAWKFAAGDASNPGATEDFKGIALARKDQLAEELLNMPIVLDNREEYVGPSGYWEPPDV